MRLAKIDDGFGLLVDDRFTPLSSVGLGEYDGRSNALFESWAAVRTAVAQLDADVVAEKSEPVRVDELQPPVGSPRQIFALALNYADHAAEAGVDPPDHPLVFPKFPSCLTGPSADVLLGSNRVDWEVELVVVIGAGGFGIEESDAWSAVAGLTVGQDLSDRRIQARPPMPHFALAKSGPTYGPIGPGVVTPDELDDPESLAISCEVNGEVVQSSSTSQLIFSVPSLIAEISAAVRLEPGDLIFTGTPAGVGASRRPRRYLEPGDELVSTIEGIGSMTNVCTLPG